MTGVGENASGLAAPPAVDARVRWVGEHALLVEVATQAGPEATRRVAAVAQALENDPPACLVEVVPSYTSVLALLDPFALARQDSPGSVAAAVRRRVRRALAGGGGEAAAGRVWEVPVRYGGEGGPDLGDVAAWAGLTPADVVRYHTAVEYTVLAVGFRPGYPFCGFVDPRIAAPRRAAPRQRVEIGSVGIAGRQTGVYPRASSGGWQIVGRTELPLFDPLAPTPSEGCRMRVGDTVRFVALPEGVS